MTSEPDTDRDVFDGILERAGRLTVQEMVALRRERGVEISLGARPPASSPALDAEILARRRVGPDRAREIRRIVGQALRRAAGGQGASGVRGWWTRRTAATAVENALLVVEAGGMLADDDALRLRRPWERVVHGIPGAAPSPERDYARANRRAALVYLGSFVLLPILFFTLDPARVGREARQAVLLAAIGTWLVAGIGLIAWRALRLRAIGERWRFEAIAAAGILAVVGLMVVLSLPGR